MVHFRQRSLISSSTILVATALALVVVFAVASRVLAQPATPDASAMVEACRALMAQFGISVDGMMDFMKGMISPRGRMMESMGGNMGSMMGMMGSMEGMWPR